MVLEGFALGRDEVDRDVVVEVDDLGEDLLPENAPAVLGGDYEVKKVQFCAGLVSVVIGEEVGVGLGSGGDPEVHALGFEVYSTCALRFLVFLRRVISIFEKGESGERGEIMTRGICRCGGLRGGGDWSSATHHTEQNSDEGRHEDNQPRTAFDKVT